MSRFYCDSPLQEGVRLSLEEATAKHIIQVLRMHEGEKIQLTNGNGGIATAIIDSAGKKSCIVLIEKSETETRPKPALHLAIAFTKNASRNEWLLEKATELGVTTIIPLSAQRSERERIKHDRWKNILVSAMLQSQQTYLPTLAEPFNIPSLLTQYAGTGQKFIGHCMEQYSRQPMATAMKPAKDTIILIGPEGDFTEEEVNAAASAGFEGIIMGDTRLRTETAAMTACAFFKMINHEKI